MQTLYFRNIFKNNISVSVFLQILFSVFEPVGREEISVPEIRRFLGIVSGQCLETSWIIIGVVTHIPGSIQTRIIGELYTRIAVIHDVSADDMGIVVAVAPEI